MVRPKIQQKKLPPISVRFLPDTMKALKKAAEEDGRPLSMMIDRIVTEYLREQGYLKSEGGKK
jgi:hypothetical protein